MPLSAELQVVRDLLALFDRWNETVFKDLHVRWIVEPEPVRKARALLATAREDA